MAKGQKKLQEKADTRSDEQYKVATEAQQQLKTGTPEYQEWQNRVKKRQSVIESGDYSTASDFDSNKSRLAEQKEIRDNALSVNPTGASGIALAYADPNQIALSQKIADNEFARDQAAQSEEDIRSYKADTFAQEQQLLNNQINTNQSLMGTGFSQSNIQAQQAANIAAQRSNMFAQMVGMALGGVSSLLMPVKLGGSMGGGASGTSGIMSAPYSNSAAIGRSVQQMPLMANPVPPSISR